VNANPVEKYDDSIMPRESEEMLKWQEACPYKRVLESPSTD